jgi:hypothetical protein
MALLILNQNKDLFKLAESEDDANYLIGNLFHYKSFNGVIQISNEDFIDLKFTNKLYQSYDGSTVTYKTDLPNKIQIIESKEWFDNFINSYIEIYDNFLNNNKKEHSFRTKVLNAKEALSNIDTSSLNYPTQFEEYTYLKDNNIPFVSYLQF